MRLDRLLGITVYLLNREKASARQLAERFEVSRRTIQRDMDALGQAGIPIVSTGGSAGGYAILDSYRMDRLLADDGDYSAILTALKGLSTAYANPKIEATLDKAKALMRSAQPAQELILDFSVLRQDEDAQERLNRIREAIVRKTAISFDYTNSSGHTGPRKAEPIALVYKWYSWYLLAFCTFKEDYRLFKIVRMDRLAVLRDPFTREHEQAEALLAKQELADRRRYVELRLLCKPEARSRVREYLNARVETVRDNGDAVMSARLPEDEQMWFGMLLALVEQAIVLEPDFIRQRLADKAHEILQAYL